MKNSILILLLFFLGVPVTTQEHTYFDPENHLCACSKQAAFTKFGTELKSSGLEMDQKYHRFQWFIDPAVLYISGVVTSVHEMQTDSDQLTFDLSTALTVDSVIYHNLPVPFIHSANVLTIQLPQAVAAGVIDSVSIFYQGSPVPGVGFGSFAQGFHDGIPIIWTLSQPYGCSDWWPCKNGLTDKIDSIDIFVSSPLPYRTATNGLLVNEWVENGIRTCHWKHRYPIVPYLVAIAVSDYAIYSDWVPFENDSIEVLNYVFPGQQANIQTQTPGLIPIMELFNELLGPYPFILEKYGHAQFGRGGGMEHQTMSFMGSFGHELMAHELAHSWFGNKITLGSWEDIWVNEGFATYLTGITYEHMFDGYYWPFWKQQNISFVTSQPGGSVHVDDTTSVWRIFNARLSYSKGALILHQLRWIIGDEYFYTALNNILSHPEHAYGFIRTTEVIEFFEQASQRDLGWYFDQWYYGQGYPTYMIHYITSTGTEATITVHQERSHPSVGFFTLPVPIRLTAPGFDTLLVLDNTFNGQSFTVDPGFIPQNIVFDPDLWLITSNNQVVFGTDNLPTNDRIRIFPNPAHDRVYIEASETIDEIRVFSPDGRIAGIYSPARAYDKLYQISTQGLNPGLWIVQIRIGENILKQKLTISGK